MAIQVGGTTVVNDSRQLQNIASLDATTAATISAAGGGATSLITDWTNTPNSDTWSISLSSSYDIIRIYLNRIGIANTFNTVEQQFQFQYSGGTDTAQNYAYLYADGALSRAKTTSVKFGQVQGSTSVSPDYTSGFIEIAWHGDSSRLTQFTLQTISEDPGDRFATFRQGVNTVARAHTSILFSQNAGSGYPYISGQYLVMGVSL